MYAGLAAEGLASRPQKGNSVTWGRFISKMNAQRRAGRSQSLAKAFWAPATSEPVSSAWESEQRVRYVARFGNQSRR